jgi:1,2-phenylacetyl-CoA epoxidase PaaB subunit
MKKPRDVIQPRWGVYVLREQKERIGSVEARDEKEALERAFKEYAIERRQRWLISVQRET